MKNYNWVFFGSDEFAVIILEKLLENGIKPNRIVCAPDSLERRKKNKFIAPPVKDWSKKNEIEVLQPTKLNKSFRDQISDKSYDFFMVASYGKIISQKILDIPQKGVLNIHPSLLPKYRGASPIESAILDDKKNTGVTLMQMDAQMDHGPIVAQRKHKFKKWPNRDEVRSKLARDGANLFIENLEKWINGEINPIEQDYTQVTYTDKLTKKDAEIDLKNDDEYNFRKIQAFHNWYNAYFFTEKNQMRVIIRDADLIDGKLEIRKVIPEGKKEISWGEFQNYLNS